jgi:alpha-beta hydrolase superfamily lysophospholipase
MNDGYREQAVMIGRPQALVCVVSTPATAERARSPAVVFINTGIVHRVGDHRMYVTLARQLANAGHLALRFDLSGIGDSGRRAHAMNPEAAALEDIREVVDWAAAKFNLNEFVVVGLCSGSDIALRYGPTDRRVVGLVLLDPQIPPTARYYINYVRERIRRPRSWLTFASGRGPIWGGVATLITSMWSREKEPIKLGSPADLEHQYRTSLANGIHLFVALTGGELAWRQTYREQLLDAFPSVPFADKLRLEYFPTSDHTFSSAEDRSRLNDMIEGWLCITPFGHR